MTTDTELDSARAESSVVEATDGANVAEATDAARARATRWWAVGLGVGAAVLGYAGAGIPSYWGDEAASVLSAIRPWPSLGNELAHIDAVHGAYYAFLHLWIEVFGASEWSTRAPSAIAVGLMAAGTVVLAARWFDVRVAVVAGIVAALLPRTTFMAGEARSYAIAAALAVWLTVWVQSLIRGGDRMRADEGGRSADRAAWWRWALYGLAMAAAATVFFYLVLLPIVHLVMLFTAGERPSRRQVGNATIGGAVALAGTLPILWFAAAQRGQLGFLASRGYASPMHVLVEQWFAPVEGIAYAAVLGWALILVGVVAVVARAGLPQGFWPVIAWVVVPTTALLLLDATVSPTYNPRYLSYTAPAAAILIALGVIAAADGVSAVARRSARSSAPSRIATVATTALVVVFAVVAAPTYLAQRAPYAKDGGSDLREVAAYVQAHANPGDAVVTDTGAGASRSPRLSLRMYPDAFAGLADPQLRIAYDRTSRIWDDVAPVAAIAPTLQARTVWALELSSDGTQRDLAALQAAGYTVTDRQRIHRTVVYKLEKGA